MRELGSLVDTGIIELELASCPAVLGDLAGAPVRRLTLSSDSLPASVAVLPDGLPALERLDIRNEPRHRRLGSLGRWSGLREVRLSGLGRDEVDDVAAAQPLSCRVVVDADSSAPETEAVAVLRAGGHEVEVRAADGRG